MKYGVARVQGTTSTEYQESRPEPLAYEAAAASMFTAHNAANTFLRMTPAEFVAAAKFLRIEPARY